MINYKKLTAAMAAGIIAIFTITGCAIPWQKAADDSSSNVSTASAGNLSQSGENALSLEFDSEDLDSSYNESECTKINLSGSGATVSGSGVTVENGNITITSAGSYIISGTLTDGSIKVNCSEKGTVRLILNGASISSSSTAPVVVEEAKKVLVTLADGTTNTITDKTRQSVDDEDFSSAVYSKADLVFNGSGTLNVNAGYRNGIKSTDDLKVVSGTFNITSNEDGIIGKDFLGIKDGKFTIKSGSDGMKSTYDTDTSKGNIVITGGEFDITASNDGIHCNEDILISGGNLTISSGDDGVHADDNLQVDGGTIDIKKCCEGLEGVQITLNDGDISIVASDDGINAADGSSSSGMGMGGFGGGQTQRSGPRRGENLRVRLNITFEEAAFGCEKEINVGRVEQCPDCKGTGCAPGTTPEVCPDCKGTGSVRTTQRTPFGMVQTSGACKKCGGRGKIIHQPCPRCGGRGAVRKNQTIKVKIPAGIDDGQTLNLRGKGNAGLDGGPAGDLLINGVSTKQYRDRDWDAYRNNRKSGNE